MHRSGDSSRVVMGYSSIIVPPPLSCSCLLDNDLALESLLLRCCAACLRTPPCSPSAVRAHSTYLINTKRMRVVERPYGQNAAALISQGILFVRECTGEQVQQSCATFDAMWSTHGQIDDSKYVLTRSICHQAESRHAKV